MHRFFSRISIIGAIAFLAVALSACASGPESTPMPLPPPIEFATFQELAAACDTIQDRPVMVRGTLQLPGKTTCEQEKGRSWCGIWLDQSDPLDRITIYVHQSLSTRGEADENEMEWLPYSYEESSLKVHTETGRIVGDGDLVAVIGWTWSTFHERDFNLCDSIYVVQIR